MGNPHQDPEESSADSSPRAVVNKKPLTNLKSKVSNVNLKKDLRQRLVKKEQELKAIIQQISEKEYVLKRKIMLMEKENNGLRGAVEVYIKTIDALNRQVDLLGERERDSLRPRKELDF
jgi:predicted RNase H-like nuclease (RuvC/YqgF family)